MRNNEEQIVCRGAAKCTRERERESEYSTLLPAQNFNRLPCTTHVSSSRACRCPSEPYLTGLPVPRSPGASLGPGKCIRSPDAWPGVSQDRSPGAWTPGESNRSPVARLEFSCPGHRVREVLQTLPHVAHGSHICTSSLFRLQSMMAMLPLSIRRNSPFLRILNPEMALLVNPTH